jgi:hypothetical protein
MTCAFYVTMNREEILLNLPYRFISETARSSVWNTGRRRRLFDQTFDLAERGACLSIIQQSNAWEKTGAPERVSLSTDTLSLWERLASFCFELTERKEN